MQKRYPRAGGRAALRRSMGHAESVRRDRAGRSLGTAETRSSFASLAASAGCGPIVILNFEFSIICTRMGVGSPQLSIESRNLAANLVAQRPAARSCRSSRGILLQIELRSDRQPAAAGCCWGILLQTRRRRRRQPAAAPWRRAAARVPQVRSCKPVRSAAGSSRVWRGPLGPHPASASAFARADPSQAPTRIGTYTEACPTNPSNFEF